MHASPSSLKAQIEVRLANGERPGRIARETGTTLGYVTYLRYLLAPSPTARDAQVGDDDKHIALIARANHGRGFPFCVKAA